MEQDVVMSFVKAWVIGPIGPVDQNRQNEEIVHDYKGDERWARPRRNKPTMTGERADIQR